VKSDVKLVCKKMKDRLEVTGLTPSEQYLGKLCRRSFLRLWSYQNVFTDRGVTPKNRQGKELCDLLVVFENDIIIFSDKSCAMPDTGNVWVDWSRWYRRAIAKSADQIYGAERWLAEHPDRVFLDPTCEKPFPLPFPPIRERRVHCVVVALGSSIRAEAYFGGNSRGSLMLANWLKGDDHLSEEKAILSFKVGYVHPTKGYVHVFDDITLDIILSELDTISDFVRYLEAKEALFAVPNRVLCAGEEDLLGFYLEHADPEGNFAPEQLQLALQDSSMMIHIAEGIWDHFSAGPYAAFRKEMKQASRFVDGLIEHMTHHVLAGTLAYGAEDSLADQERNLRFLASEPRHWRATFATAIAQKLSTTPSKVQTSIVVQSTKPDRMYVFLLSHGVLSRIRKDTAPSDKRQ
jgi:hypothetical protein